MNKWFVFIICIFISIGHAADVLSAEVRRTHHVFYKGENTQALLQIKVTGQTGDVVNHFSFNTGKTKNVSNIRRARLFYSGNNPGFAPNAAEPNRAVEVAVAKNIQKEFSFTTKTALAEGTNHFWLVYDIATGAAPNNIIDAECTAISTNKEEVMPQKMIGNAIQKERPARIYSFPHRIVPYYRPRWVKGWGNSTEAVHLTPRHFELFTDLIHFAYTVTADGQVGLQWVGEGANPDMVVSEARAEIKRLRRQSKGKSRIIAGFGHMDDAMTAAVANPVTRDTLARNMAQWAIDYGYNGIDIDWEYPDTSEQWQNFGLFIARLREELAGSNLSISIASSVTYKVPIIYVTDQLDFLMTMSYDDTAQEHASMWRFQNDAKKCLNDFRMLRSRIVIGLPFYSNEKGKLTQQFGYEQIHRWYPKLKPNVNDFISKNSDGTDGPPHSFNGPDLIRDKCRWMKKEKFGGVMIWAYDTDIPLSDKASLGKALYSVVRQTKPSGN